MLLRHNDKGQSQFVYEFYMEDRFATSYWFTLPSMGVWIENDHPWIVIMREAQRVITQNWADLNCLLKMLEEHYQEWLKSGKSSHEGGQTPTSEEILAFLEKRFNPEEWDQMYTWFTLPWEGEWDNHVLAGRESEENLKDMEYICTSYWGPLCAPSQVKAQYPDYDDVDAIVRSGHKTPAEILNQTPKDITVSAEGYFCYLPE